MKKRKVKKSVKLLFTFLLLLVVCIIVYQFEISKVSNDESIITLEIKEGSTYSSLASLLKENNLIKSEFFYKIYIKLNPPKSLQAGDHELRQNMSVKEIIEELEGGTTRKAVTITFKEGINFEDVASLISQNTEIEEQSIYKKIQETSYLNELIDKYWFLTEDIKQKGIYYPLEGYLFPDTYEFYQDSEIEDIFETMLNNTERKLASYKDQLNTQYSIHEMMTIASIVELEASNSDDRAGVAGVFYNRLENNWALGSDVTTYYGLKLKLSERDLTIDELNEYNDYNTRSSKMAGKLPISPICMPSLESIVAAFNPEEHDYFYFVADKTGKTYFNKTSNQHTTTINKLKSEGLWYEY